MTKCEQVKTRRPKIVGITRDARELGVTRQHLYLVLHGERPSPRLLQRYRHLKRIRRRAA